MSTGKRIGFIDLFIDEWHANNYPAWIRENTKGRNEKVDVSYVWAEMDNPNGMNTASWSKKNSVEQVSSLNELVEKSDYIIVLSPDNPEYHERLSQIPLMSGKQTTRL